MSIEKKVIITDEHEVHRFTVEEWRLREGFVKITYDEVGDLDEHFVLPTMNEGDFKSFVESVNFVMGWSI